MNFFFSDNVTSLVFGVIVPLSTMAAVAIGCGDNHRSSLNKKKKVTGQQNRKPGNISSSKKSRSRKSGKSASSSRRKAKQELHSAKKSGKEAVQKLGSAKDKAKDAIGQKLKDVSSKHGDESGKSRKPGSRKSGSLGSNKPKSEEKPKRHVTVDAPLVNKVESMRKSEDSQSSPQPIKAYVQPEQLSFKTSGGVQPITVHNHEPERIVVKAKFSENTLYRVNPVFAFIEPGKSVSLNVYRNSTTDDDAKTEKLVLVVAHARDEDDPRKVFKSDEKYPMMVLPLFVSSANALTEAAGLAARCVCVK